MSEPIEDCNAPVAEYSCALPKGHGKPDKPLVGSTPLEKAILAAYPEYQEGHDSECPECWALEETDNSACPRHILLGQKEGWY